MVSSGCSVSTTNPGTLYVQATLVVLAVAGRHGDDLSVGESTANLDDSCLLVSWRLSPHALLMLDQ